MAEVLVIGGGPAGLATAIACRLEGLEVQVVDRGRPPIDKACGEGLMPDALERLRQLGVELAPAQQHPFYGIRYLDREVVAEGRFPGSAGAGVRRVHLHAALVRRAAALAIPCAWDTRIAAVDKAGALSDDGQRFAAAWIVGADGLRSRVRRWAQLEGRPAEGRPAERRPAEGRPAERRFGVRRHVACAPWSDCVEVYWADGCEAYVTPVAADEVGVAILWSGRKADFDTLLASFPALAERLAGVPVTSRDRGAGPLRQRVSGVFRGRVALVGDASGYVDAITGEGMALAFHQAQALAEALRRGDLRGYARQHRRLGRFPDHLTALLLGIERRPWLRRRMVRALAREPALFSRFLAVLCRARPLYSLGLESAPRLLWRLVQP